MGKRISNNFKKRFGYPARIKIEFVEDKLSPSEKAHRNEKTATAFVNTLRNLLGREPTQNEILGKADISKTISRKNKNNQ